MSDAGTITRRITMKIRLPRILRDLIRLKMTSVSFAAEVLPIWNTICEVPPEISLLRERKGIVSTASVS